MKEKLVRILFFASVFTTLAFGAVALADDYGLDTAATQAHLPKTVAGESLPPGVIGKLLQYALSLIGIIFFLLVLYAGFLWMSAMGNSEKIESAKSILETAVIGLALVLGAYAITSFVISSLSAAPSTNPAPLNP